MFKKIIVGLAVMTALSVSAETYKLEDNIIVLDVNESTVSASNCRMEKCFDFKIDKEKLVIIIEENLKIYSEMMNDSTKLYAEVESSFKKNSTIKENIISDDINKKEYVMVNIDSLNINIPMDRVSTKDERMKLFEQNFCERILACLQAS